MHHVAGSSAELRRVHICRAPIACRRNNQQVYDCGDENDVKAVAEDAIIEIDLGELGWNLSRQSQLSATGK
jgi:hypothetical protein